MWSKYSQIKRLYNYAKSFRFDPSNLGIYLSNSRVYNAINNFQLQFSMLKQQLTSTTSKGHFTSQMYTHSRAHSPNPSIQRRSARKASCSNLNNFLNIDQLIEDVKITQIKQNGYSLHIENIKAQLESFKGLPLVKDQIFTVQLLLDTINRKLSIEPIGQSRGRNVQSSVKKSALKEHSQNRQQYSPIKDFSDGSSIVYTKFSLKQMENSTHLNSKMTYDGASSLATPKKSIAYEQDNGEMEKLNNQIIVLQKLLKNKGLTDALQPHNVMPKRSLAEKNVNELTNKHQPSYKHSQSLCPPFRKNLIQKCKSNNAKQKVVEPSRQGKIKVTQSKFR